MISDPVKRARALEQAGGNLRASQAVVAEARRAAVAEAKDASSAQSVAEEPGISRARIYAILDGR